MVLLDVLLGFGVGLLIFVGMASLGHLHDWRPPAEAKRLHPPPSGFDAPWAELLERAERQVSLAQAELPEPVRAEAVQVPTLFEEWHPERARVLGIYRNFRTDLAARKGPIVLYLRAIESWCRRSRRDFDEQVRATYLHELGHHVGWNEGQVRERQL
jgi:predicted Zn-dependent protease with MMP-like domain